MLFQSNLRKQIRKLPKILKFVRIIHYYSKLFTGVLRPELRDVTDLLNDSQLQELDDGLADMKAEEFRRHMNAQRDKMFREHEQDVHMNAR